jgi:hypothetical protein
MAVFKKNTRLGVLAKESVAGTAETFADTDYNVRMRELELASLTVEMDDEASKFATGDHSMDEAIPGVKTAEIAFNIKMSPGELTPGPSATAGTSKLAYDKVLETAGLIKSYTGDLITAGTYTFVPGVAGDTITATLGIVDVESGSSPKGILYKIAGAMSTLSFGCEGTGKPFVANLSYTGKVDSVSELDTIPVYSDDDGMQVLSDKFLSTTIRITGVDAQTGLPTGTPIEFCSDSFNFDTGITVTPVECQSDASGIIYYTIVERKPMITINPRLLKLSDWDFWEEQNDVTLYKVEVLGTNVQLTIPRAQLMSTNVADSNGYFRNELGFRPLRNIAGSTAAEKEQTFSLAISDVDITA